jgi:uncharacterized BrkB/YihY/UPF0761 family membrane protein
MAPSGRPSRCGFAYVRVIAYLLGFGVLLFFVVHYYLIPALQAAGQATPRERRILSVQSRLVLALILFILLVGLILVFRVGRFFFPRHRKRQKPTNYPDAWAESARRVDVDESEQ